MEGSGRCLFYGLNKATGIAVMTASTRAGIEPGLSQIRSRSVSTRPLKFFQRRSKKRSTHDVLLQDHMTLVAEQNIFPRSRPEICETTLSLLFLSQYLPQFYKTFTLGLPFPELADNVSSFYWTFHFACH